MRMSVKEVTTVQRKAIKDQVNAWCSSVARSLGSLGSSRSLRSLKSSSAEQICSTWSLEVRGRMHRKFSHSRPPNEQKVTDLKWFLMVWSCIRLTEHQHFNHQAERRNSSSHTRTDWFSTCLGKFFTFGETKLSSFNGTTCLIPGMCLSVFHCAAIVRSAVKSLMKALTGSRASNQWAGPAANYPRLPVRAH